MCLFFLSTHTHMNSYIYIYKCVCVCVWSFTNVYLTILSFIINTHRYIYIYIYIGRCSWVAVFHLRLQILESLHIKTTTTTKKKKTTTKINWINLENSENVLKCLYFFLFLNIPYFLIILYFLLIVFYFLTSSPSQFYPTLKEILLWYKKPKKTFKNSLKTLFIHASNPWWRPMKGSKVFGTVLVNSSTNSNLKPRHLSGNLKGS